MPKPSAPRYRTTNWSSYNAALKQRGSLSIWFDRDLDWCAARTGKRGHPETFSDQAIQACLTLKVLFGLPLRQTVGLVASLIKMAGLDPTSSGAFSLKTNPMESPIVSSSSGMALNAARLTT